MTQEQLRLKLEELKNLSHENEWVEFKHAETTASFEELGKYFSALSNEANLKERPEAWLVYGIDNRSRRILGTRYKDNPGALNELKLSIANHTNGRITFRNIHEYLSPEGRVLMFEIPPCVRGIPTSWKDVVYGREGESLKPLSMEESDLIRAQASRDWSGEACQNSKITDLDKEAVSFLRKKLKDIYSDSSYLTEPEEQLLNRLSLLKNGTPTTTAMLFLGKTEVVERLLPEIGQISWKYEDQGNSILERAQLRVPLLPRLYDVERNIHRFNTYLRDVDLFRKDLRQYDDGAIEELLVNSLVHRDWSIPLWIEIHQTPLSVEFRNPGIFRADLAAALNENLRPPYVNRAMADFFQKIRLMEKEGGGLRRVYFSQLGKGTRIIPTFYRDSYPPRVDFRLMGQVENIAFAKLVLSNYQQIELPDLLLLDKIASGNNRFGTDIPKEDAERLKRVKYIEIRGTRNRRCYISKQLSESIGRRSLYIREKGLPREKKIMYILSYLDEHKKIKMSDVYDMFPEDPQPTLRYLVSMEMCRKRKLLQRRTESKNKHDWYYTKA
ncbi:MAG TPA: RNA-binding domain-containing protein [Candidatus Paceibacterota bacterium]|nr:RNA-binding domain-containing protein [Candidatus Paceibacterota bacterium]